MDLHRYIRYVLGLVLTAVFLLHAGNVLRIPLLSAVENRTYDVRMSLLPPQSRKSDVVIVDVDEPSLDALGRWPWNRDVIADIVDNLFGHYRIKAIGFDVVFAEADQDAAAGWLRSMAQGPLKDNRAFQREYARIDAELRRDDTLARSLKNRKTVLGYIFGTDTRKGMLPAPVAGADIFRGSDAPFIKAEGYTANLRILQSGAYSAGFFDNPLLDDDGVYRRVPLLQEFDDQLYESLPLALVRSALGSPRLELLVRTAADQNDPRAILEWVKIEDRLIPVDAHGGVLIPYHGPARSFAYLPAVDILHKTAGVKDLEGKIVLFGTSAAGLSDLHTTSVQPAFPGVEIHANVVQGILDQTIMHRPGYMPAVEMILILAAGALLTFVLPLLPPPRALAATGAVLLLLTGGSLFAWSRLHLVLSLATPLLFVLLMFVLHASYGLFVEARRRRRLTRIFGQYIPPELVEEMSRQSGDIRLDGEIREMSVLFSDVHHFTSVSERMEPRELTRLLNEILTPVTEAVHEQRGTIDKYMGDSVMAFWGAPLNDAEHALHAVTAALNMVQRVSELNQAFRRRGWPDIRIGIGINTGNMNVGNKGSEFRVGYTVLGDAVNLGSRLEGLTRTYDVDIIAGENTRRAVSGFEFREIDRVRVKGRDTPITIYEPLGPHESVDASVRSDLERFHRALEAYRDRRWDEAEHEIAALRRADPERRIYQVYLERIAHYRKQPPPEDWDGSYAHESK